LIYSNEINGQNLEKQNKKNKNVGWLCPPPKQKHPGCGNFFFRIGGL